MARLDELYDTKSLILSKKSDKQGSKINTLILIYFFSEDMHDE